MSQQIPPGVELAQAQAERLERLFAQAERELLVLISQGILRGTKVQYLQDMLRNVESLLADLRTESLKWAEQAVPIVYKSAVNIAEQQLQRAGVLEVSSAFGKVHVEAAQVLAENAFDRLDSVTQLVGRRTQDIYRNLALEASRGSVIGYQSYKDAANKFERDLAERGITGFVDRQGIEWNMKRYANTVARTTTMETHLEGTKNRFLASGRDLVIVSRNGSPHKCCNVWEGVVLSLTGKTPGYKTLAQAKAAKLFHPNCRHTFGLYVPIDKEIERLEALLNE